MNFFGDNKIKVACFIALTASLVGAMADVALLYHPDGGYESGDYAFLLDISDQRLLIGSYLGIFFIPLEALGLFHIYEALKPAGKKWANAIVFLGVYTIFPGVAYHGTVGFTATFLKLNQQLPNGSAPLLEAQLPYIKSLFEPIGAILFALFAVVSLSFTYVVAFKTTRYKMWMALFNPLAIYMVFVAFYLWLPVIGNFLIPAGFNLSFFFFFIFSLLAAKK